MNQPGDTSCSGGEDSVDGEIMALVERWRRGDESAATALYEYYVERLLLAIKRNLAQRHLSHMDPEDVVQSAFNSWFIGARVRRFEFETDTEVWKLLLTIALNKVRNRVRAAESKKRDVRLQQSFNDELAGLLVAGPNHDAEYLFTELLQELLKRLDQRERLIVEMKLNGYQQQEIADQLRCSRKTVQNILKDRVLRNLMNILVDGSTVG